VESSVCVCVYVNPFSGESTVWSLMQCVVCVCVEAPPPSQSHRANPRQYSNFENSNAASSM